MRIVFDGGKEHEPVISMLSRELNVDVNILSADMKRIGGKTHGQMMIEMPEDSVEVKCVADFLESKGLTVKEVVN